jgi:predicted glutamine amidotransferase
VCRWLVYSGSPLLLSELLYRPAHSLIDQSRHARMGAETTNGDGFGIAWYDTASDKPALFRSIGPAWSDRNLRELADHVRSGLFFAHVRASTGTAVQQTNSHPFRHDQWVWMHNGAIARFADLKRDLMLAVDPDLFPSIEGSTDSELMFYLALTFGLRDDPPGAVERMVGLVEQVAREQGVVNPMQMTVATSDGVRVWAFRYSSAGASRTLFYSTDLTTLTQLHPDVPRLREVSAESRIIVSEPLGDLSGAWNAVPESCFGVIQPGPDVIGPFRPDLRSSLGPGA